MSTSTGIYGIVAGTVVLVAAVGSLGQSNSSATPPQGGASAPIATIASIFSGKETCRVLWEFAHADPFDGSECVKEGDYQSLLATVPDPVNTHLSLLFDRAVESIQNAANDAGWDLGDFNFPWDPQLAKDEADPIKREEEERVKERIEDEPGVLLFRKRAGTGRLAILLIAEKAVGGPNKTQFEKALSYLKLANCAPLNLIGPMFSGSVDSVLDLDACKQWKLFSGTVTSDSARAKDPKLLFPFVYSDGVAMEELTRQIRNVWKDGGPVAILTEGETLFGTNPMPGRDREMPVDVIRFPREIANLRNSSLPSPELGSVTKAPPPAGETVPLDLRDNGSGHDSIPNLSGQAALNQEAVLFAIGSRLRQTHYSLVGVVSTNILDSIYLSRFVRTICPDTRVFLLDQDLLYTRASVDSTLYGTLSVVTYPLRLANEDRPLDSKNPDSAIQFSSQLSEGTYNAAIAALAQYGTPQERDKGMFRLRDYKSPDPAQTATRAPLWITVLGRNAYWPVALIDFAKDSCSQNECPEDGSSAPTITLHPGPPGRFWSFLYLLSSLALIGLGGAVLAANWFCSTMTPRWLVRFLVSSDEPENLKGRAYYLGVLALVGGLGHIILGTPYWLLLWRFGSPDWSPGFQDWIKVQLGGMAVISALLVAAWCGNRVFKTRADSTFHERYKVMASLTAGAVALSLILVSWLFWRQPHLEDVFVAWRSLDLFNGVSPVTPLLLVCLGLCCWAWIHLGRLTILDYRRAFLPLIDFDQVSFKFTELYDSVEVAIRSPFAIAWGRCLIATLVFATLVLGAGELLRSFESRAFQWLYQFLLGLLLAALSLTLGRFLLTWTRLKRFLRQIERHPIRQAISTLPPEVGWGSFLRRGLAESPGAFEIRMLETARRLEHEGMPGIGSSRLSEAVGKCMDSIRADRRILPGALADVRWALSELYDPAVVILQARWITEWCEVPARPVSILVESLCGKFIVLPYVYAIRTALLQLRNMTVFLMFGFILAWLSLNSYPFQALQTMNALMIAVFLILGGSTAVVLAQVSKNTVLSHLTSTTPGKLDVNFFFHLAAAGGLPLLTVIASQMPWVSRFLFSWIEPTLQVLNR